VAPLIVQDKRKWNSSVFCHMPVPFEPGPAPFPTGASGPTGPVTRSPPQVRTAAINHEASSQTLFRRPLHPVFCWPPQGFICAVFIDWRKPIFRLDPGIALMWPVSERIENSQNRRKRVSSTPPKHRSPIELSGPAWRCCFLETGEPGKEGGKPLKRLGRRVYGPDHRAKATVLMTMGAREGGWTPPLPTTSGGTIGRAEGEPPAPICRSFSASSAALRESTRSLTAMTRDLNAKGAKATRVLQAGETHGTRNQEPENRLTPPSAG
jgi:hypothetical protein